jgi:hypothetical protein
MEEECSRCGSPINRGEDEIEIEDPETGSVLSVVVEAAWCEGCGAYKVWA